MALIVEDRVRETTTTTGTSAFVLAGAVTGYVAFSAVMANADTTFYAAVDITRGDWETGVGTYVSSTNSLARTLVLASSNAGAAVVFAAGAKYVFLTQPAERAVYHDGTYVVANGLSGLATQGNLAVGSNATVSGNMAFIGTGNRITGDFSNATIASRVMFQTSTVNGNTVVAATPNGTASIAGFTAYSSSTDPGNASVASIQVRSTDVRILSDLTGTGTYLPMTFYTGGSVRLTIDTGGGIAANNLSLANNGVITVARTSADYNAANWNNSGGVQFQIAANGNSEADIRTITNHPMVFWTNNAERMRIDTSGNVLLTGTGGLGYGTGAGGTVTQATSKSTTVTLNKPTGQITMNNAALGAGASVVFILNNTSIGSADVCAAAPNWAVQSDAYTVNVTHSGGGFATFRLTNVTAGSRSEAVVINFVVIKGATA